MMTTMVTKTLTMMIMTETLTWQAKAWQGPGCPVLCWLSSRPRPSPGGRSSRTWIKNIVYNPDSYLSSLLWMLGSVLCWGCPWTWWWWWQWRWWWWGWGCPWTSAVVHISIKTMVTSMMTMMMTMMMVMAQKSLSWDTLRWGQKMGTLLICSFSVSFLDFIPYDFLRDFTVYTLVP